MTGAGQSQVSLTEQIVELHRLAVERGLYDAADWLAKWMAVDEGVTS